MSIKGFLFDFDGTLFFNSYFHLIATGRVFERYYGLPSPDYDTMINKMFGRTNRTIVLENIDPNASEEKIAFFEDTKEREYRELCLENPNECHLVDGACELLDYLKENNIPRCIATGAPLSNVNFYREQFGIDKWFGDGNIIYADSSFPGKPAPDIYIRAAKHLGLDPSECVVFEDGTSGIQSAHDAGCGGIVAVYDQRFELPDDAKAKVDIICHDLTDWRNILASYGL